MEKKLLTSRRKKHIYVKRSEVAMVRKGVLILGKQPLGPLQTIGLHSTTLGISTLPRPIESSENPASRICAT
jgi:hypothetical protein